MDGTLPPLARPRLTPGIPAGGVVALLLTLGLVGYGLMAGPDEKKSKNSSDRSLSLAIPPVPPVPPTPPTPPAPRVSGTVKVEIDSEALRESIRSAMNGDVQDLVRQTQQLAEAARALKAAKVASSVATGSGAEARFNAQALNLVDMHGTVIISVSSSAEQIGLRIRNGGDLVRTSTEGNSLTLIGGESGEQTELTLTIPEDQPINVTGLAGNLEIKGAQTGHLNLDVGRGSVTVERAESATIRMQGSGKVKLGKVQDEVTLSAPGLSDFSADSVGSGRLDLPGKSRVRLGRVEDGLTLSVPGHADVEVNRVDGPVTVSFHGAGRVVIHDGTADPLRVEATGAGEFRFEGRTEDPQIIADGSALVQLTRSSGTPSIHSSGAARVLVQN